MVETKINQHEFNLRKKSSISKREVKNLIESKVDSFIKNDFVDKIAEEKRKRKCSPLRVYNSRSLYRAKPFLSNRLPLSPLPFQFNLANKKSPVALLYMGTKFSIGDFVAVNGDKHYEYYGVISGFDLHENGQKYFRMVWLLPKNQLPNKDTLSMNDFDLTCPAVTTTENMGAIKYIFDSIFDKSEKDCDDDDNYEYGVEEDVVDDDIVVVESTDLESRHCEKEFRNSIHELLC
jgi:hypothetical protein